MEYSSDFKKNFATAYLAEEYERLEKEVVDARASAGEDPELAGMAAEDEARVRARQTAILAEIEQILAKEREQEDTAPPISVVMELRAGAGGDEASRQSSSAQKPTTAGSGMVVPMSGSPATSEKRTATRWASGWSAGTAIVRGST